VRPVHSAGVWNLSIVVARSRLFFFFGRLFFRDAFENRFGIWERHFFLELCSYRCKTSGGRDPVGLTPMVPN